MCTKPNQDTNGVLEKIQNIVSNHNALLLALYESRSFDGSREGQELLMHCIESTDALIEKLLSEKETHSLSLYQ